MSGAGDRRQMAGQNGRAEWQGQCCREGEDEVKKLDKINHDNIANDKDGFGRLLGMTTAGFSKACGKIKAWLSDETEKE